MALLDSKQLNPKLTGSFILSGSTQTFIGASDFQGSITASGDISGSGNIFGSGNIDIDGTANIAGITTLQSDLNASGNITGSGNLEVTGNISGSVTSTGSFGRAEIAGYQTVGTGQTITTGGITVNGGNISGSSTSTGSFGSVVVSDKVQGNLKIGEGIVYNDTNKRLGIGDPVPTSPESELHIKAATPEITIQRTDNNNDGVIDFQGSAGYVGAKIAHSGTDNNLVFHTYTGSTLKERLTITGGSAGTKISGSAVSTGSFGAVVFDDFISGSSSTSASFGRIDTAGSIYASGRVYEAGTSIVDHATAMAIVFGG